MPYKNPYGTNVKCVNAYGQTNAGPTSPGMTAPDGFKQACANGYCFQSGEPITVWRNPSYTPVFDAAYRYSLAPMSANGKAIDVACGSTNNGTTIQQYAALNTDAQKFTIQQSKANWKIALKANTNKCVGPQGKGNGERHARSRSRTATAAPSRSGTSRRTRTPAPSRSRTSPPTAASTCRAAARPTAPRCRSTTATGQGNQKFKLGSGY